VNKLSGARRGTDAREISVRILVDGLRIAAQCHHWRRSISAARSRQSERNAGRQVLENGRAEQAAALADDDLRKVNRLGWGSDRRRARNLDRYAAALHGVGRDDEARRLETRAQYLRAAIEDDRAAVAAARQRDQARRDEPPGVLFEGEEEWPLATPVFIFD